MEEILQTIRAEEEVLARLVFSDFAKSGETRKIALRPVALNDPAIRWQAEEQTQNKAFQKNLTQADFERYLEALFTERSFRQVNLFTPEYELSFRISKKGNVLKNCNRRGKTEKAVSENNAEKAYFIREGDEAPFLQDLGIFTSERKIVRARYDKFRQINRFLKILDHALKEYDKGEISILDFGCGKSYLTFLVYYYFQKIRGLRVRILGYDLKKDVVEHCNALAKKYGYAQLQFVVADVTRDALPEENIDMVLSLHACDTATDYALFYAMQHRASYIFSVPCCQHEINAAIRKGGDFDLFFKHGIFKERFCALLTDAIRAQILEKAGYKVDVLEFVDFAHSPKNLMLRARKKAEPKNRDLSELLALEEQYHFRQTLLHLALEERKQNAESRGYPLPGN